MAAPPLLLLLLATTAPAAPPTAARFMAHPPDDPAFDAAAQARALRAADAAMSAAYRAALARAAPAPGDDRLRTAQRAWLGWRDQECAWRPALAALDSQARQALGDCYVEVTRDRATQLRRALREAKAR